MEKMWTLIKKFAKDEEGMETVEYAVVGALVITATALIWITLGEKVSEKISQLTSAME